ncbi:MAG: hypothetical protein A2014_00420 [Spirochaetes bacterium GWF1_49_6]|nr:MAG: hypothetical protein A2014_00420 [Spirochaetes bacterium GWF1_49_6]
MVLSVAGLSSSAYYGKKKSSRKLKRGPKTEINDNELLNLIREEIAGLKFFGMGYIKIWIRINRKLEKRGLSVGRKRTYRVMKDNNLLEKSPGKPVKNKHDGKIITDKPNVMWATDGKRFWTRKEGWCWFFGISDHFNSEIIAFHTTKNGDRFNGFVPLQEAVNKRYGGFRKGIAEGLSLRTDLGSIYTSGHFRNSAEFLGIEMSYTWAKSPESNGIIERFHRTLEEQVFKIYDFETLEEATAKIKEFVENYNREWMLARLGYMSPLEARKCYEDKLLNVA